MSDDSSRRIRVQTVLYGTPLAQIWRLRGAIDAAARNVIAAGLVGSVEWAIGDSSPAPCLGPADAAALHEQRGESIAGVFYESFDANLGSSGGSNRLAAGTSADFIFVLNPDTYPSPVALRELVSAIDQPQVAIAEARQLPLEHPKSYNLETGDTSWASGCCMLIRGTVFEQLGGFDDEHFLLHCDDVDLSWRVRSSGHRVVVAPLATVFHDKRPRRDGQWPAPDIERYHAALGRLMLATRWDRGDILEATIATIETSGAPPEHDAVQEFRARRRAGRIPRVDDNAADVAQFIDGEYADHRF